jgi:hypothetical protein
MKITALLLTICLSESCIVLTIKRLSAPVATTTGPKIYSLLHYLPNPLVQSVVCGHFPIFTVAGGRASCGVSYRRHIVLITEVACKSKNFNLFFWRGISSCMGGLKQNEVQ